MGCHLSRFVMLSVLLSHADIQREISEQVMDKSMEVYVLLLVMVGRVSQKIGGPRIQMGILKLTLNSLTENDGVGKE